MKALAACVMALPFVCFAQGEPGIQPLREFNLQLVAEGHWNPVGIDWDAKGRMWMAITTDDPLKRTTAGRTDSIIIFNGSSIEQRTRFSSSLKPVGGFVFHRDGIIVAEGSQVILLRDTDGDSVADKHEVLLSRLSLTSLRWGMDRWIYGVLSQDGTTRIIRFKPEGGAIETVSEFKAKSASLDFTWDHELFVSRAEGPHISHVGMAEKYFSAPGLSNATSLRKIEDHQMVFPSPTRVESVAASSPVGWQRTTAGIPFSRVAGAMIYEGGAWPERYQGNYYVCDPDLRLIHEDVISRPESPYFEGTRRLDGELLTATLPTFRPHELRFGPDGAMYVLTSSVTPGVKRGLTTPRSPLIARAQPHGAIWRIQHKQARALPPSDPTRLTSALEHPNGWARRTAVRLLAEQRDQTAAAPLDHLALSSRFAPARVSALWTLHHLGALGDSVWTNAITDFHPGVQKNAWLIFAESQKPVTPAIEKIFSKQYKDADERVKLAMLLALSKGPLTSGGRESLLKLFPDLKDVWSKSVVLTMARTAPLDAIKLAFASDKSENFRELVVPLVEQLEDKSVPRVLELTAKHEKAEKLTAAVKAVIAKQHRE
jgi:hypothetical protein